MRERLLIRRSEANRTLVKPDDGHKPDESGSLFNKTSLILTPSPTRAGNERDLVPTRERNGPGVGRLQIKTPTSTSTAEVVVRFG